MTSPPRPPPAAHGAPRAQPSGPSRRRWALWLVIGLVSALFVVYIVVPVTMDLRTDREVARRIRARAGLLETRDRLEQRPDLLDAHPATWGTLLELPPDPDFAGAIDPFGNGRRYLWSTNGRDFVVVSLSHNRRLDLPTTGLFPPSSVSPDAPSLITSRFPDAIYDPTNGTMSPGDLIVTGQRQPK